MNKKFIQLSGLTILLLLLATSCQANGNLSRSPTETEAEEKTVHWQYGGPHNPTHWGELSPEYWPCSTGKNQSPTDLKASKTVRRPSRIEFEYQPTPLEVLNNGHTIQVNYVPGSSIKIDGKPYALQQFHFHTPSEHTVDGKAAAMELHLVHQNEAGEFAVVGVLIEAGAENPNLSPIWQNIPEEGGTIAVRGMTVNASSFLPPETAHYHYIGSLTTPPCSEGVDWTVMVEPITASTAQIDEFMEIYPVNARPIQALNNREIEMIQ